jgi:large subunit ribosomal protein L35Ae
MTKSQPVRLYQKGTILGYKRGQRNSYEHTSLIKIDGVSDKESSDFYLGKKIAYIYKAKVKKNGSPYRVVWGKVMRRHGNSGVVRAKFAKNLSPTTFGQQVRIMLYPSSI